MKASGILLGVAVAAIAYPLVMRFLIDTAQPMRLKMAELGNRLLDDKALPEGHKAVVAGMMDDAFEWRFMLFAASKVPGFAWGKLRGRYIGDATAGITTPEARKEFEQMIKYFTISTAVANPIFFILAVVELFLLLPCVKMLKAFGHNSWDFSTMAQRVVVKAETLYSNSWHRRIKPL